jgi:hypothetical protein
MRLCVLALVLCIVGCADSGPLTAPVSGVVRLNGKPLPDARVTFQPMTGDPDTPGLTSWSVTAANGAFTLKQEESGKPGAQVGKCRVMISLPGKPDPGTEGGAADGLPARYNESSDLEFDVPRTGSNQANFDLKSP